MEFEQNLVAVTCLAAAPCRCWPMPIPATAMRSKRFGIEGDTAHTLEELGHELGVTRERVWQLEAKALRKLRRSYMAIQRIIWK